MFEQHPGCTHDSLRTPEESSSLAKAQVCAVFASNNIVPLYVVIMGLY